MSLLELETTFEQSQKRSLSPSEKSYLDLISARKKKTTKTMNILFVILGVLLILASIAIMSQARPLILGKVICGLIFLSGLSLLFISLRRIFSKKESYAVFDKVLCFEKEVDFIKLDETWALKVSEHFVEFPKHWSSYILKNNNKKFQLEIGLLDIQEEVLSIVAKHRVIHEIKTPFVLLSMGDLGIQKESEKSLSVIWLKESYRTLSYIMGISCAVLFLFFIYFFYETVSSRPSSESFQIKNMMGQESKVIDFTVNQKLPEINSKVEFKNAFLLHRAFYPKGKSFRSVILNKEEADSIEFLREGGRLGVLKITLESFKYIKNKVQVNSDFFSGGYLCSLSAAKLDECLRNMAKKEIDLKGFYFPENKSLVKESETVFYLEKIKGYFKTLIILSLFLSFSIFITLNGLLEFFKYRKIKKKFIEFYKINFNLDVS